MDQLGVGLHNFYRRKQGVSAPSSTTKSLIAIAIKNPEVLKEPLAA